MYDFAMKAMAAQASRTSEMTHGRRGPPVGTQQVGSAPPSADMLDHFWDEGPRTVETGSSKRAEPLRLSPHLPQLWPTDNDILNAGTQIW